MMFWIFLFSFNVILEANVRLFLKLKNVSSKNNLVCGYDLNGNLFGLTNEFIWSYNWDKILLVVDVYT